WAGGEGSTAGAGGEPWVGSGRSAVGAGGEPWVAGGAGAASTGAGVTANWPQATSWPAAAQGWSVVRVARTVSHVSAVVGGRSGRGTVAASPGVRGGTVNRPVATGVPSSSRDQSKARWERSSTSYWLGTRLTPAGSGGMRTVSTTFLSSCRPGDGVRSGNSRPSATKLPSGRGSPKSPPVAANPRPSSVGAR